jgi:hypothetical protein
MTAPARAAPAGPAPGSDRGSWLARRTGSERRTLAVGAVVSALALLAAYGVAPAARRWGAREAIVESKVERLARLRALARDERALGVAVRAREARLAARPQQPLAARTPALAAAALQTLVQGYAAQSQVSVSRIEAAGDEAPAGEPVEGAGGGAPAGGALPSVVATVVGTADVYGLAALLGLLQHGPRLVEVTGVQVQSIPGPRGEELLQLSLTVRAPYAAEGP